MTLPNNQKYLADTIDKIAELWGLGLRAEDIGSRLGIPKNSICRLARTARMKGDERFPERRPKSPRIRPRRSQPRRAPRPPRKAVMPRRHVPAPKLVNDARPRIWELRESQCKYPIGSHADTHEHVFCAKPSSAGKAYCSEHDTLCNLPPGIRRHPERRVA